MVVDQTEVEFLFCIKIEQNLHSPLLFENFYLYFIIYFKFTLCNLEEIKLFVWQDMSGVEEVGEDSGYLVQTLKTFLGHSTSALTNLSDPSVFG